MLTSLSNLMEQLKLLTTLKIVFSVTYYLELGNAITIYEKIHNLASISPWLLREIAVCNSK
jgi:hypothetical protein